MSPYYLVITLLTTLQVPAFVPPAQGPTVASSNYVGSSNGSLPKHHVVPGKQFDRFIQVLSLLALFYIPLIVAPIDLARKHGLRHRG